MLCVTVGGSFLCVLCVCMCGVRLNLFFLVRSSFLFLALFRSLFTFFWVWEIETGEKGKVRIVTRRTNFVRQFKAFYSRFTVKAVHYISISLPLSFIVFSLFVFSVLSFLYVFLFSLFFLFIFAMNSMNDNYCNLIG